MESLQTKSNVKKYLTEFNDESFNFVNSFRNQLQLSKRANIFSNIGISKRNSRMRIIGLFITKKTS